MTVSTHVLDANAGSPAAWVAVTLSRLGADGAWSRAESGVTDAGGRLRFTAGTGPGTCRLTFGTGAYFAERGIRTFYPEVVVAFTVDDEGEHYHVPLLLSPFAYSTYRGS